MDTVLKRLDVADKVLTNLDDCDTTPPDTEAFTSAISAARSAINSARAMTMAQSSGTGE